MVYVYFHRHTFDSLSCITYLPRSDVFAHHKGRGRTEELIRACPKPMPVCRFSDVGDAVLVSGGSRDSSLAALVLNEGRTLIALEPEVAKINATSEALDALTVAAAKIGMWSRMLAGPVVTVGPNRLPIKVPPSNVAATRTEEAIRAAVDSGEVENPEMKVAMGDAQAHGIEIRVCTCDAAKRRSTSARCSLSLGVGSLSTRAEIHYFFWRALARRAQQSKRSSRCSFPSSNCRIPRSTARDCSRRSPSTAHRAVSSSCR